MLLKRVERLNKVYDKAKIEIKKFTNRAIFIADIFLYMGKGLKTKKGLP
jgi:hypothetical protein